ncbi:MAG: NAD(P)H-quinone oxidoreductase [Clostridia bacterium]|nr:NAD(P)H-quinone oxidoreductase [Clostridia bacterium]
MKAILINDDQSLCWDVVPDPVPKPDEVLIEIRYAALNRADLMQRAGNYPPPPGAPEWMGLEVSGVVCGVGEDARDKWKVGDRVCALLGGGGYAEYVAAKADMVMPVPEGLGFREAAALPEAYATAYLNLFIEGKVKPGETFLMQAGASGLASVVIPMAKAFGVRTLTTVLDDAAAESIRELGADRIVVTGRESLVDALKEEEAAGHPVNAVLDCLGGRDMGKCLPYLARGARWIMIATLAGDMTEIDLRTVYVKNIRIIGSTLRSRTPEMKGEILAAVVRDVFPKVTAGLIRPSIFAEFPIEKAEEAQALMASGKHHGKIVMRVR